MPSLAREARQVTMLQRSPTYVIARPRTDRLGNLLRRLLPEKLAYRITRGRNIALQRWLYRRTRRRPDRVRRMLLDDVRRRLGDSGDVADFTPSYDPWDQRLCLLPDGDLFTAMNSGRARVVTADIERFTAHAIELRNGERLEADIIVAATGLELEVLGGVEFVVDGENFDFPASWTYRGMMCTGLPNAVAVFGYINASWTLRADLIARWFCRLLRHMRDAGQAVVVPTLRPGDEAMRPRPWIEGFSAGYMQRALPRFPRQGDREPWVNSQDYARERREFAAMDLDEEALRYRPFADSPSDPSARPEPVRQSN